MELVKIDNELIRQHPLWNNYGSNLNKISERDYGVNKFFKSSCIDCIDVDFLEKHKSNQADKTVDAAIGISSVANQNNTKCLMLVELRLDYQSINNVSFTEWKQKVKHSICLLTQTITIRPKYFFVFNREIIAQVVNKLENYKHSDSELKKYEAVSDDDFEKSCIMPDKWPVPLLFNAQELEEQLNDEISRRDIDSLVKFYDYWNDKAIKFNYKNRTDEVKEIKRIFKKVLSTVRDTSLYDGWIELIIEEFDK